MNRRNNTQRTIFTEPLPVIINSLSIALKERIQMPEWASFVKTSPGCENIPLNPDWWYVRSASILQKIARKNIIGQRRLSKEYRRSQNRGVRSNQSTNGSRKIIRVILQDLENINLLTKVISNKGVTLGRSLTSEGMRFINNCLRNL